MKKYLILVLLLLSMIFSGCSTGPMVFDPSVPLEQSSKIILNSSRITKFNGKKVSWIPSLFNYNRMTITIPSGRNTFDGNFFISGKTSLLVKDVTYDFLPGKTYYIYGIIYQYSLTKYENHVRIIDESLFHLELIPNTKDENASVLEGIWVDIKEQENKIIFAGNYFIEDYKIFGKINKRRGMFNIDGDKIFLEYFAGYGKIPGNENETWFTGSYGYPSVFTLDGTTLKSQMLGGSQYNKLQ